MLVDVKRDKALKCLPGYEKEYKTGLKELGEYKLHRIKRGFYHTGLNPHFILEDSLKNEFPEFGDPFDESWLCAYGVCDSTEQFIDRFEQRLEEDPRKLMVSFRRLTKEQAKSHGWRWHKNGPYIGDKHPQHEYLGDEDDSIRVVYNYHIREIN